MTRAGAPGEHVLGQLLTGLVTSVETMQAPAPRRVQPTFLEPKRKGWVTEIPEFDGSGQSTWQVTNMWQVVKNSILKMISTKEWLHSEDVVKVIARMIKHPRILKVDCQGLVQKWEDVDTLAYHHPPGQVIHHGQCRAKCIG